MLDHLWSFSVVGFEVPDKFVVGYALDYNEYFRDLNVSHFSQLFLSHLKLRRKEVSSHQSPSSL